MASEPQPAADVVPTEGRLLGIDYGTKRIGVAVADATQMIASPMETYSLRAPHLDDRYFLELVTEHRAVGFVVGLPVHMSGDEGQKAGEAREFGGVLRELTGLPVVFWDERYTSAIADEYMLAANLSRKRRKNIRDRLAAQILLQSFLDSDDRKAKPQSYRAD